MVKRILTILTWTLSFAGLVVLLGFARQTHYLKPVSGLDLTIDHQPEGSFLPYNQTYASIGELVGYHGLKSLGSVNLRQLREQLKKNPYVAQAEAYTTLGRKFKIRLVERKPILRFFTQTGQTFYIDDEMVIFPTHMDYVARVMVANGNIPSVPVQDHQALPLQQLMNRKHMVIPVAVVAKAIQKDKLLNVLIDQLFVTDDSLIELSPKIGNAPVILGDTSHLQEKIGAVSAFFRTQSDNPELSRYQSINASFRNQIVCTKNDTL
ncbi:MAG: FtsQ-type POTRA domain-containing protein [Bacteroidales bacterium]|nr:FtsQ-type POTRA domain-containing protein [Bacteroidales bacterium]